MKLKKKENYHTDGKLNYRYFEDEKYNIQGYGESNWLGGKKSKRYCVNGGRIGFEIWQNKKYYNI